MANINKDIFSDEIFDILCSMCTVKGQNKEGKKFCVNCSDYFCLPCVKLHRKVPICLQHNIVNIDDGQRMHRRCHETQRCEKHSSRYIDMYCQDHDNVGCSICMSHDHSFCEDKFFIEEFLQNNDGKVHPKGIQRRLNAITETLTEQIDECSLNKENLLKRKAELIDNIARFRQEINDQLDRLQQNSVDDINAALVILEDRIEEELKHLKVNKARVESAYDKLASRNADIAEMFVYSKVGEYAETKAAKCIDVNKINCKLGDIDFKVDRKMLSQLKEEIALSMITVENKKSASKILKTKLTKTERKSSVVDLQQTCSLLKTEGSSRFRVKTGYDSEYQLCNITGACFMHDGKLILADEDHEHVKVLDRNTFKVKHHFVIHGDPWQVCPVDMQEVAVTIPSRHRVFVLSLDKRSIKYSIKTKFECRGIAFANEDLYISDTAAIYIYNVSDKKLKPFSVNKEQELFSVIYSLAANKDGSRIYVADQENGLIVLDNNGEVVGNYNGLLLQGAHHCCVTREGSVLVSAGISNNIVQFTSEGDIVGEIVKYDRGSTEMVRPVCCNHQMTMMCTSTNKSDYISVYSTSI